MAQSVSSSSFHVNELPLQDMAYAIRFLAMDAVQKANSGHPGMPMGMADVATVLFAKFLKFDVDNPKWPDRDRFILSAGHGSMLLYALSYLVGYEEMTLDQLKNFRQLGALTAGHPEYDPRVGIEMTTGPLGQGISTAVGFSLAERHLNARFGDNLVNHYTYVIASDGDLMEGVSHEACSLAGHLKLDRLIVLYDSNDISIDGSTELSYTEDSAKRFEAYGWDVQTIDGHDFDAIEVAINQAKTTDKPSLIICRTTIAFGAPTKAGTSAAHGSPLGDDEIAATRSALGWNHSPFEIPENLLKIWRDIGTKGQKEQDAWQARFDQSLDKQKFEQTYTKEIPKSVSSALKKLKESMVAEKPGLATRKSSGKALEVIVPLVEAMVGGSADLTPSNNTLVGDMQDLNANNYSGRYIRYGVREHGMATIMNGMALHGGVIPYAGTFLSFADYSRPAIRLAALMKQQVIHVMTHDSIGLGEDGPTHQPVEHLAALRAIPNVYVFRPADTIETIEAWEIALNLKEAPSILALSRQSLKDCRAMSDEKNLVAKGGYVLRESDTDHADLTLIATGSEVSLAIDVSRQLLKEGFTTRIVSIPCRELFLEQESEYCAAVLGQYPRVILEAGIRMGWEYFLRRGDLYCGVETFGESAPASDIFDYFGLTTEKITEKIIDMLASSDE